MMSEVGDGMIAGLSTVGVFVSHAHADVLTHQSRDLDKLVLAIIPRELHQPILANEVARLAAVVVEVDPGDQRSIDRMIGVIRSRPDIPVIAATMSPQLSLVRTLLREGVADVVGFPIDLQELVPAALDALARTSAIAIAPALLAPLIGVVRTSGGSGATTVATHLAGALARSDAGGRRVLVADCDLQFGSVGAYLDAERSGSLSDIIAAHGRIDQEFLNTVAPMSGEGIAVLATPPQIEPMSEAVSDPLFNAMEDVRRHYDVVVADFPSAWSNWAASLAYGADYILLVTEVSLQGARQARRTLDLFDTIGVARERVGIVANKVSRRTSRTMSVSDLTRVLGQEQVAMLPLDDQALGRAQDQGVLVTAIERRNGFAKAIAALADRVVAEIPGLRS